MIFWVTSFLPNKLAILGVRMLCARETCQQALSPAPTSPVYQWRKALRRNMAVNCSLTRLNISCRREGTAQSTACSVRLGDAACSGGHATRHRCLTTRSTQPRPPAPTWMAVELPMKVALILRPRGGMSQMEDLTCRQASHDADSCDEVPCPATAVQRGAAHASAGVAEQPPPTFPAIPAQLAHIVRDPLHKVAAVLVLHVQHLLIHLLQGGTAGRARGQIAGWALVVRGWQPLHNACLPALPRSPPSQPQTVVPTLEDMRPRNSAEAVR